MKKLIFIFVVSFTLLSCDKTEAVKDEILPAKTEVSKDMVKVDPSMSNPELFLGSGFGPAFMSFIRTQNFELALQFTSKESIEKHGADVILEKYKSLKTDYKFKRTSGKDEEGKTVLRNSTNEFATSKYKDFVVVVENDSCKLVLPDNLDEFLK